MEIKQKIVGAVGVVAVIFGGSLWFKTRPVQASHHETAPTVTINQAIETVQAANPGTTVIDVNLERENNKLVWEAELNNGLDVYVNANTREIIKTEQPWNLADFHFFKDWIAN
ncbi:MAG: PepSY domain-containing protein [Fischerella sp.]|nr:PepSY domain-containing protein [Fischerella sp.]